MALCNLLCTPEAESQIIGLNAVGAFDALAQCPDSEIRERCVCAHRCWPKGSPKPPFRSRPLPTPTLSYLHHQHHPVTVVYSCTRLWGL